MARLTAKKSKWYEIPGDPDKARLKIKHLIPGEVDRINSETSRWIGKRDAATKEFNAEMEYSPQNQARKFRVAAVVDWENFLDANGLPMQFNPANLDTYLDHDPELGIDPDTGKPKSFSEWVDYFQDELSKEIKPAEVTEKN